MRFYYHFRRIYCFRFGVCTKKNNSFLNKITKIFIIFCIANLPKILSQNILTIAKYYNIIITNTVLYAVNYLSEIV